MRYRVQVKMPVTAIPGKPGQIQEIMESESDEELDSEDLDESDGDVLFVTFIGLTLRIQIIQPHRRSSLSSSSSGSRCWLLGRPNSSVTTSRGVS